MPVNQTRDVDLREWPLDPAGGETVALRVTHTTVVKNVGSPSQTIEHTWEAEIQRAKTRVVAATADTQAAMDNALNTWRLAIVDARAALPDMA